MRVLVVSQDRLTDLVKLHPDPDEVPQTLCQQTQLRPGRQAVQHKNTAMCFVLFNIKIITGTFKKTDLLV